MASKSKAPTGLAISRSGNNFICEWKFGEKNYSNGQEFKYSLSGKTGIKSAVGVNDKKKTITINLANYYPTTTTKLTSFAFTIRGDTAGSKTWSDLTRKALTLKAPKKPTLSMERQETDYSSTFSWETSYETTGAQPFYNVELQTMLVQDNPSNVGSNLDWSGASSSSRTATSSITYTEQSSVVSGKSYTRWVRVRSRGCAGASDWAYAYFTYAAPNKPKILNSSATKNGNVYEVEVEWENSVTPARPVDNYTVQYKIDTPIAGLNEPSGSWTTARTIAGTNGINKAVFTVQDTIDEDECLFVSVQANHDIDSTISDSYIVAYGELEAPTDLEITSISDETHRISATADNNSTVPDSFLALEYLSDTYPDGIVVAVSSIGSGEKTFTNVQCPEWGASEKKSFRVYSVVGTATLVGGRYNIEPYENRELMHSSELRASGGTVPLPPSISVEKVGDSAVVSWSWAWSEADSAELSWSDREDAWESTEQPETYVVDGTSASRWKIVGLENGKDWYFRVRLIKSGEDINVYGTYSDTVKINLASAPATPILYLSQSVTVDEFNCYWDSDGTQSYAEICEATVNGGVVTYGDVIASTYTATSITLSAKELGWSVGSSHYLCVSLVSASNKRSNSWSAPVLITIAEQPSVTITNPFTSETVDGRTYNALKALPLTVGVTGEGMELSVIIERAEYFEMARPDETDFKGYEGETIAVKTENNVSQIVIDVDDLKGSLDDNAKYRLVATIKDVYGQTASDEIDFEVHWTHQAVIPEVTVEMYKNVPKITVEAPEGYASGDTYDIYRLSADRPQLIYEGAQFGETYVDPFPSIGGGHRIVYKTYAGDYTTEDGLIAWTDTEEDFKSDKSIIDFGTEQIYLYYNQDVSTNWQKDVKFTSYLGGHIEADWNPAITRETTVNAVTLPIIEQDTINALRRLAEYSGICHVRTIDGSSYAADIQVAEAREHESRGMLVTYELTTTRVNVHELDGMTFEDWSALYEALVMPDLYYVIMPDNTRIAVDIEED